MTPHSKNSWLILIYSIYSFVLSSIHSITKLILGGPQKQQEFPLLRKILKDGPQNFLTQPSAIKAGRSIFTVILSFFQYDTKSEK